MNINCLYNRLIAANLGVEGESLFLHTMPADCRQGILLKMPLTGVVIDYELPGFFCTKVQAIVRAQSQVAGETLAKQVSAALEIRLRSTLAGPPDMLVNWLRPLTLPIVYPRSDGNGLEWSINFEICYVMI
jgi:hypothetical protein